MTFDDPQLDLIILYMLTHNVVELPGIPKETLSTIMIAPAKVNLSQAPQFFAWPKRSLRMR